MEAAYITTDARMSALAKSFPTLSQADGIFPWDPTVLDTWACKNASHGGILAAQFVLAVWHGRIGKLGEPRKTPKKDEWFGTYRFPLDTHWRCGPFDVVSALTTWDATHREAFLVWVKNPWWP